MPLIFPTNPTPNQTYQSGSSATYRWNGVYWALDVAPTATVITATSASIAVSASFASTGSSVNPLSQVVRITGSLIVTGSITGSLFGTSSQAISASNALTASSVNTLNQVVSISGSLVVTGSITGSMFGTASFASTASFVNTLNQPVTITGSFTVFTGSAIEFQVHDIGVKLGNAQTDRHQVTGSLNVTGSITGSLLGTASLATSASFVSSPYIYLYGNPNQGINNSSTAYSTNTRIPVNGLLAPYTRGSFTVGATGITPNVTGWYEIHCNVFGLDAGGANTTFSLGIGINGVAIASTLLQSVLSSIYGSISVCGVGFATAGQLIDFRAGSTGGELITVQGMNVIAKYISA